VDLLNAAYELSTAQIDSYRDHGYIKLPRVLSPGILEAYRPEIQAEMEKLRAERPSLDRRSTYDKAFLQLTNLWRRSASVRELVFGRRLARVAAELMGCRGVRLYHDQALFKEPGGGFTPWHADQQYWPLSSDKVCTAWIPLVDVTLEMGPVTFCPGSHRFDYGRDLEIGDESEQKMSERLASCEVEESAFEAGDVSFHSGWTFHRAGGNRSDRMREIFTVIYMDIDMRLAQPKNKNQAVDREAFCPGVAIGEIIDTALTPPLYSS